MAETRTRFEMTGKNWSNVIILGVGFMLLFSAFQTTAFVQGITIGVFLSPLCHNLTVTPSDPNPCIDDAGITICHSFAEKIGYYSLCIIYLMVAIGNWMSVSIVSIAGPKKALIVSGLLYVVYIAVLIRPYLPTIFIGAFIVGTGGGVLWTAQGQILIQNSSKENMATTSGVFWFLLESSLVFGNLFFFLFLYFVDKSNTTSNHGCEITRTENYIIFSVLGGVALAGVFVLLFLRPERRRAVSLREKPVDTIEGESLLSEKMDHAEVHKPTGSLQVVTGSCAEDCANPFKFKGSMKNVCRAVVGPIVVAFKMLFTVDMILLSFCFVYAGYVLNFWSGVYGPLIGHTQRFSYYNIGLAGLFIGIGEILGGSLFGIFGRYTNKWGRDPVVLLGMLVHLIAFLLVFYNLPSQAITQNVPKIQSHGYLFTSNIYLGWFCAFLLGFGDSCYNTQIYSIIGAIYPTDDRSAPAMALYKFFQSLAAMVGFLLSTELVLQWQLLILTVLAVMGTLSFVVVEWRHYIPRSTADRPVLVAAPDDKDVLSSGSFSQ